MISFKKHPILPTEFAVQKTVDGLTKQIGTIIRKSGQWIVQIGDVEHISKNSDFARLDAMRIAA